MRHESGANPASNPASDPVANPVSVAGAVPIVDCWNRIGVSGDQSCDKLVRHVHCRNCEVYSAAAQRNLQRPVSQQYREEWAGRLREPAPARAPSEMSSLVFRIGREWLALPTGICASVAPLVPSHRLPHRGGRGLLGIVNVGGRLLPAITLGALLGIDEHDTAAESGRHTFARLLVVEWDGQQFALPVADVRGIVRHGAGQLRAPAATVNKGAQPFIGGVLTDGALQIGVLDAALVGPQLEGLLR
ncbi:chemotaxis protein CheW [Massilia glaciei]|uniref:Chemotaxis protein CheW n=1 Tax=Massilia glaciei TaxID=1524097 RepID=A0A2U2HEU1_9BURK|nr:chemotaxis protein CheW [Massilia glaciei]PWF42436.1 chemotaxis protein CheW [Massilia glaciei]